MILEKRQLKFTCPRSCLLVWYAGGYTGIYTIRVKETIIHASLVHWLQYKVTINL